MKTELTFKEAEDFVLGDIQVNQVPALLGEPGIGKSKFIKNIAKKLDTKVFILAINQLADRSDLTGARIVQDEQGKYKQQFFPHATLQNAITYAEENPNETPIIFLDEFNRTTPDVTSAIFTFLTDRQVGSEKFPENVRFIVAGNDSGNVATIDGASVTRLSIYHIKPDVETFLQVQENLNPYVKATLLKDPTLLISEESGFSSEGTDDDSEDESMLFADFEESQFKQKAVPRTITYTSNWLNGLGLVQKFDQKENDLLAKWVNLIPQIGHDSQEVQDLLIVGLQAHAGDNQFTQSLYETIITSYQNGNSSNNVGNVQIQTLSSLRPDTSIVTQLQNAQSNLDTENIAKEVITNGDIMLANTVLWAISSDAVSEVHDVNILKAFVSSALTLLPTLPIEIVRNVAQFVPTSQLDKNVSSTIVQLALTDNEPAKKIYETANMVGISLQ